MFCTGPQVSPKSAEMIWREFVRLSAEMRNIGKAGSCQRKMENLEVVKKNGKPGSCQKNGKPGSCQKNGKPGNCQKNGKKAK